VFRVENLHVGYHSSHVLEGVSLSVDSGESVALLGRNGMGKTTLVRAICGLKPPTITQGSVTLDDQELVGLAPYRIARAGVGLVPQGRQVFGSLTVDENLRIIQKRGRLAQDWTVEKVFGFFPRLRERAKSLSRTLSGGEQQMLAIGRALMTNPSLLIMDEPSEGLAPVVLRVIQELRGMGLSVLVAEQNVDLALALSDRVFILGEHGQMAWTGASADLVADPAPLRATLGL
jgi:branched-chain amino acid transport system ATP-binding protein